LPGLYPATPACSLAEDYFMLISAFAGSAVRCSVLGAALLLGGMVSAAPATADRSDQLKERDRLDKEASRLVREGKFADAALMVEKVLAINRSVLGEQDVNVLYSMVWLAELQAFAGNFPGARKTAQLAVSLQQKGRPDSHWRVGHARLYAAYVELLATLDADKREQLRQARILQTQADDLQKQRKFKDATALTQKVLEIRKEIVGEESIGYTYGLSLLGLIYRQAGDYRQAADVMARVVALRKKVMGEENPAYASDLAGLAWNHFYLKEYDDAEKLFREAVEAHRKAEGDLGQSYAAGLQNLGEFYGKRKNFERAVAVSRQGLEIYRKIRGENHPDFAAALFRLALLYDANQAFDQGEPLLRQAIAIYEQSPKDNMSSYIQCLKEMVFVYGQTGKHSDAIRKQQQIIELEKQQWGPEHPDVAESLQFLRYLYVETDEFEKALDAQRQAGEILKKAVGEQDTRYKNSQFARSWLLHRFAVQCQERDDLPSARKSLEELLELRTNLFGKDDWRTADVRRFLAFQSHLESIKPEQRAELREAEKLWQKGWDIEKQGTYRDAIPFAEQAMALRRQLLGNDHWLTGDAIFLVGWLEAELGDLLKAESLHRESLEIVRKTKGESHPDYSADLHNLATLDWKMGDFSRAETVMLKAVELTRKLQGEKSNEFAVQLTTLALIYEGMGDYVRCEQMHRQALAIRLDLFGPNHREYAHSLFNLAALCANMGDYVHAEPMLLQAAEIRKKAFGEKHPAYATCLNSLGELYRRKEEFARAEPYYQQALAIRKETLGEKHPEYAISLNNLGLLYSKMGKFHLAAPCYEKAVAISKETVGEQHLKYALAVHNLAWLCMDTGKYDRAEPLFRQSIEIHKQVLGEQDPKGYANGLNSLARLYGLMGDPRRGIPLAWQAVQITRTFADRVAPVQSERQQLALRQEIWHYLDLYLALSVAAGIPADEVYQQVLAWKGFVSARQQQLREIRAIQAGNHPETAQLCARLEGATRQLAVLSRTRAGSVDADRRFRLQELGNEVESLQAELAKVNAAVRKQQEQRKRTPEDIRKVLPPGAVLIDFLAYEPIHSSGDKIKVKKGDITGLLVAFIVRADRPVERVELGPAAPISKAIEAWRKDFGLAGGDESADAVLRRLLWLPLEKHVGNAAVLLVSPNSMLAPLPWGALPGSKPGTYLIEERAIAAVPIPQLLPDLLASRTNQANSISTSPSLLVVGDVDFDAAAGATDKTTVTLAVPSVARAGTASGWGRLPASKAEVDAIKTAFTEIPSKSGVTELRGPEPTAPAVRRLLPQYRYLHFATHGFFAPPDVLGVNDTGSDPGSDIVGIHPGLLSGIVLAGANQPASANQDCGILTALEVGELDLSRVELATLSACETGLGQAASGEGVLGLQRAFQTAGARTVVASLWKVDDQATQELMVRFYENLWRKKLPKLEALRQAQLSLIRGNVAAGPARGFERVAETGQVQAPVAASPRLWAAWVLSGDPGDLRELLAALAAPAASPPRLERESDSRMTLVAIGFVAIYVALFAWLSRRQREIER
jgi:CHAT domain-containing protein/tetratricopeptide (TPR) repeat protein